MSKMQVAQWTAIAGLTTLSVVTNLTVTKQQEAIEKLLDIEVVSLELAQTHTKMLWDLHRRTQKLEREDKRLSAHIKWYIMERSGIRELARLERAMERKHELDKD